jgi:hypothetical protein
MKIFHVLCGFDCESSSMIVEWFDFHEMHFISPLNCLS